jgi:transcriptional regulator with XRE-family HTH domain
MWARIQKGFERAKDAAESMGMKPGTYNAYERPPTSSKHTKLDHQRAAQFARKFGVRYEWLLEGRGEPMPGPKDRVAELMDKASPEEQARIVAALEALTGTHG